ncbi:hypothetical protein BJ912DRAFT_1143878 [Pholiota molesta]|nr:hypothetical protein BJ912DRAFT_1143878 [Pholiota molesta]
MAQPSQQFPPWLSPSAFIVTDAAGTPVATETSIVYIPPTYFGPSIPLGTLYVFGGSTEPATVELPSPTPQTTTTVAPPSTTATPSLTTSLTTTATPTTTVSISSTTAITTSSLTTSAITTSSLTTSAISTTSSSAPSTSSLTTSATSTTSSFSSSVSSNTIPNSTLTSTSATNTSTAIGPAAMAGLTKGQLVGVIVASILGLIFLFVLALFLYLWCRGRRNRRGANTLSQGIDDDYYFVPEGAGRVPGEGSPRHSGEEQDPFLQRSSGAGWAAESSTAGGNSMGAAAAAGAVGAAQMAQVPSNNSASRPTVARVPPPTTGSNSSQSTGSHASGFGVLLDRPSMSLGLLPITSEHEEHRFSRQLSNSDMARIGRESVLPDDLDQYPDDEYTGAYAYSRYSQHPPPRLVGAATATTPLLGEREASPHPSFEEPTLLTARRVKVEDLGPRTASQSTSGPWGLNLGRLSWFRNLDSPRSSGAAEPSYTTDPLLEKDLETGRGLLSPASAAAGTDSFGARARGAGPDGTRPRSGVSARTGTSASGGTLYHDAESSVPGTPVLAPLPRAITPGDNGHHSHTPSPSHSQLALSEQAWLAGGPLPAAGGLSGASSPPGYEQPLAGLSAATSPTGTTFDHTPGADVLDMPAPPALTHFASISSMKETATVSSVGVSGGYKPAPFPPLGWTPPTGSFGVDMGGREAERGARRADSMIDVLEDAPPDAELGWRAMAAQTTPADLGRRGTFGTYVHGLGGIMSERGSLHSMRSHFSPSSRSTGSAPASRRDFESSIGSAVSSRPSVAAARSPAGSVSHYAGASAHAQSLAHKASLSSEDRRLGAMSPALSAFGHQARHGSSRSGSGSGAGSGAEPPVVPVIGAPPEARMSPDKLGGARALRAAPSASSDDAAAFLDTSFGTIRPVRSLSPLSATFPMNAPWAGGLDSDWQPSA